MGVDYIAVSAYLDGEIHDESQRRAIEAQLESSPVYAGELRRMQQTRMLMQSQMVQPAFHRQLMLRVQELEQQTTLATPAVRWLWRIVMLVAVLTMLAALGDYTGLIRLRSIPASSLPQTRAASQLVYPGTRQATQSGTATAASHTPDSVRRIQGPADEPAAPAPSLLPLALRGTVGGAQPMAVIENTTTGKVGTYRVGDTVTTGVKLLDVRYGQVVLSHEGKNELLATASPTSVAAMTGRWQFVLREAVSGKQRRRIVCNVTADRGILYFTTPDGKPIANGTQIRGHIRVQWPTKYGTIQFEGDIDKGGDALVLTGVAPTGRPEQPHYKMTIAGRKIKALPPDQTVAGTAN